FGGGYSDLPVICLSIDIPAISDYDGDGDMDIITWTETATTLYFFEGQGVDNGDCEEISFEMTNRCYGMLAEGTENNAVFIGDAYAEDLTPPDGIADKCGFNVANPRASNPGERHDGVHTGGTLVNFDLDQNGIKDLMIGDVTYNNMIAAYFDDAVDNQDSATIVSVDFPAGLGTDVAVDLLRFPAGFYEDVNNDGINDLLVCSNGTVEMNDDEGIWLYLNENENDLPAFTHVGTKWLQETSIEHGRGAHPILVDVSGDGLKDLIVSNDEYFIGFGDKPSQLAYYQNIGTAEDPSFNLVDNNFADIPAFQLENIHPSFGDLDADGDLDMILGEEEGVLHYFENTAGAGNPMELTLSIPAISDSQGEGIDVGKFSTPMLFDVDDDGRLDMVVGEKNGVLSYYKNSGSIFEFAWELQENDFENNWGNVQANNELGINGYSIPYLFRDEDSNIQLLVGNELGQTQWFNNISGNESGEFTEVQSLFFDLDISNFASPWFEDLNGDGMRDYLVGNNRGGLRLFIGDVDDSINVLDPANEQTYTLYPNPSNGIINVRFESP
ncbi:MAG: VCBS repeat-containing protein, partial [Bacteroidota bacterium]